MNNKIINIILCLFLASTTSACQSGGDVESRHISVGNVQREIRTGMSGADVIRVLGSPNIVTTDENKNEVWVYDRISTESVYSKTNASAGSGVLGFVGVLTGMAAGSISGTKGSSSSSQKTLTININFDSNKMVSDFSYHTSRF